MLPHPLYFVTIVKMFMPRMAPLVESGRKKQTVRGFQKRLPTVGDHFSGREWTGRPYRSKQRSLVESTLVNWASVWIYAHDVAGEPVLRIRIFLRWLPAAEAEAFAVADGFEDLADMRQEFERMDKLPLERGTVFYWL